MRNANHTAIIISIDKATEGNGLEAIHYIVLRQTDVLFKPMRQKNRRR